MTPVPGAVGSRPPGTVVGILGPTGVGKTAVAVELAQRMGVRVISCDSMQVYSGFPVLTNQPTGAELDAAAHELISFVDPRECFSAAAYAAVARPLIDDDVAQRGWALVVGGTGLYLRAALAPLAVAPAADPSVRARLEARVAADGAAPLHAELSRLDPAAAKAIGPDNVRRLVRALEAIEIGGGRWSGRDDLWQPRYYHPTLVVGLTLERAELYARIDARAASIVKEGGIEEVRRFLEEEQQPRAAAGDRPPPTAPGPGPAPAGIESAIGFREIGRYLEGGQSLEETITQVATSTRRYVRRQTTWLRKLGHAVIIDVRDRGPEEVAEQIFALAVSGEHTKEPPHA